MTQLLDLPVEILVLIFEEVGGRNLRRNLFNLTLCHKWYEAAHEVYLSGLDLDKVDVLGCNVSDVAGKWKTASQRQLMRKNTCEFRTRLLGHWWDSVFKEASVDYDEGHDSGNDQNGLPPEFNTTEGRKALMRWQENTVNPSLKEAISRSQNNSRFWNASVSRHFLKPRAASDFKGLI